MLNNRTNNYEMIIVQNTDDFLLNTQQSYAITLQLVSYYQ